MAQTYYEILGVAENATAEEIEAAFKKRAREVHPDTVPAENAYLRQVAAEAFKDLSEAKAVLLDRTEREKYDARLTYERDAKQRRTAPAGPSAAAQGVPRSQNVPPPGRAQQAQRARPARRPPRPLRPLPPWKPSSAELSSLLFVVAGLGLVFFLVGMMWSGRNPPLWLAVIIVALGLLSFRQGMKPVTGTTIPGGKLSLAAGAILFVAILLVVWILSEPNFAPETARLGIGRVASEVAKTKTAEKSALPRAADMKPTVVQVDPGGATDASGFVTKIWNNPADGKNYGTRLNGDLLYLDPVRAPGKSADDSMACEFHRAFAGAQSWTGVCSERDSKDQSIRKSPAILSAFSDTRIEGSTSDRPSFVMVPVDNVQAGSAATPGTVVTSAETEKAARDLSTLHGTERELVESICLSAKIEVGQAEYDRCVEKQLAEMKSLPPPPDLSGLSDHDKEFIESQCSGAKMMQGPTAYNDCVTKQLESLKKTK